ncbi:cullin-9-like isoform X2 [Rhea pennata]|uniref:cullin-9-like isoform X2 n=1 Tax=Rhea pennata TaxID=8795 RepID=UPI002E260CB9
MEQPGAGPFAVMVSERRNGSLLVHLGPTLQAYPEELLRQRRGRDGHPEYLIRWSVVSSEESMAGGGGPGAESKPENILMWMSAEEVCASCPALLGQRKLGGRWVKEETAPSPFPADIPLDEASLLEMKADVGSLVQRAARQMAGTGAPESSVLNTIHVLSAYASIGSLTGAFKETGALDLLMKMLCHKEKQIRRSAGKMLRALASHDAGSRAYVLLSLSQQDGIEQHMGFDSRYTLLELFAETMSSEEYCMSFEGIHLPQIPGKLLFALVKRYLRVASLEDELSGGVEQGGEAQDHAVPGSLGGERSRVKQEFEFSMAMAGLISELVHVMGWEHRHKPEPPSPRWTQPRAARSIFQPKAPACPAAQASPAPRPKEPSTFKTRSAFPSRSSYVEYVQANLVRGMRVRMLEDYEQVSAGDEGDFRQSNDGTPPVQVYWQALGCTYWVHWHMVEIIGPSGLEERKAQERVSTLTHNCKLAAVAQPLFCKPFGGLYTLPYLGEQPSDATETLSRAEWWELLFFVRSLGAQEQDEITRLVQQEQAEQLSELDEEGLIQLSASAELAQKVLRALEKRCQGSALSDLRGSRVYAKYFLGKGAEQGGRGSAVASSGGASPEAAVAEVAEEDLPAAALPPGAPAAAEKSDRQLFSELLQREGLRFPEVTEEQSKLLGSCKGAGKRGLLARIAAVVDAMQRSGSEAGLRLAGLQHILEMLEEEAGLERQVGKAQGGLGTREKVVKMAVELLSSEVAEKALVALALRLLAALMLKFEWRVPFAAEGGVRAVLARMRQHAASAVVQQAGLAGLLGRAERLAGGEHAARGPPGPGGAAGELRAACGAAELLAGRAGRGLPRQEPGAERHQPPGGARGTAEPGGGRCRGPAGAGGRGRADAGGRRTGRRPLGGGGGGPGAAPLWRGRRALRRGGPAAAGPRVLRAAAAQLQAAGRGEGCEPEHPQVGPGMAGGAGRVLGSACGGPTAPGEALAFGPAGVPVGQGSGSMHPGPGGAAALLRILNEFLDGGQEELLPWHECVEPCLSSMGAHSSDQEVVREVVRFLHRLGSASKDCVVVMCRAGAHEALGRALERHGAALPLAPALCDLLSGCEKHASLYGKLTGSILAGCIQLVLGQIEEHRRSQQPVSIPFFDVFLRNLCRDSSVEVKEDKCWEKIQVSSNPHRAGKLTDGNPKTYWESNGSTGSHSITVHMQRGVVIRELSMLVAGEDSSYMPARIVVLGGDSPMAANAVLNAVTVLPSDSRVVLLENVPRFWPVVQIRVKRCQQGGIDTRVRGIEVLGPKPTFWPVFREQLCRRTALFCAARAHAWCREIGRDRGRLLQLFGRLNRALRHEQAFADRFLPDAEAAQALGRTYWEALVTPLVQSITSPDPSGVSPLAWLLSEYLERAELPRRAAAFGSRVRHLTRLLVHVEPSGAELEEARAPGRAGGKDGKSKEAPARAAKAAVTAEQSSLWGISRCWRGVVQQQVWRFLEAAWQAPDVVERFCRLYRRLRGATAELFGQQAAFMLALVQGFAGALLQLSFPTALHVSEQFARYLDQRLRELRGVGGGAGPLQQALEPFAVLCGLELAHTFEHFYRYYLGDRLLAQGPSWLEGAVVEQLGPCFPSRFPQQMLSDLAESEELQQQFYLFRLQEQDKQLLELDAGLESPEEEVLGEAPLAEAPEVKVLLLSPRCWPVSPLCYVDEPGRFFPTALSSPLAEFADFWRQSQSRLGRECTKPWRLQWTWLGHAELQFGDCVLHVSTLQMYVLLHFNGAEEVAVDALLQATGLPADLVRHALTPLTQGEGVLVQSCPQGGTLRLNRTALARASGQRLRLLPQQTYLRAELADGSSLERKRNVLCCLVTRILKVEKQLHIDNLVFRVIDACRKGEFGSGLQFLSFCCHSVDVLSCVLHLLNQGYLRRQEERPQVLEYVCTEPSPAPTSPVQPLVAFQTVEIKTAASTTSAARRQTFSTFR